MDAVKEVGTRGDHVGKSVMREWQKPLSEEKIAWLIEQFELARKRIEDVWPTYVPPWRRNRIDIDRRGW